MFAAIIFICGLPMDGNPNITNGCGLVTGNRPFPTREECTLSITGVLPTMKESLPEGAYLSDVLCVPMSTTS